MPTQQERLVEAVVYLTEDDGGKKPAARVDAAVRSVEGVAKREGLSPDLIDTLMDFVGGEGGGSVSARTRVLRALIPAGYVPWSAAAKGLAHVRRMPLSLQQVLFRWLVLTFDLVDDWAPLHSLYTAVFYYLQVDDLRPTVCQLLCFLTRKEDVTEFRVQKLAELHRRVVSYRGLEAPLAALLLLYKSFCPHLVPASVSARRKVWFRPFEKSLAADLKRVQEQCRGSSTGPTKSAPLNAFQRHFSAPPPAKRARRDAPVIPPLAPPLPLLSSHDRVPVSQLVSIDELCDNITCLEFPRQMASVLESPFLQLVFSVWSHDASPALRLTYWLQHTLGYELDEYSPGSESPRLTLLLSRLADFTDFLLEPISVVEGFLLIILEAWNGVDHKQDIFRLLTHLSLQPFSDLRDGFLDPLKRHFVASKDVQHKYDTLVCLTELLRNFVLLEWPRHQREEETLFPANLTKTTEEEDEEEEDEDFNPLETLRMFVNYVSHLILLTLESGCGDHALISHASLSYYELVVELPVTYNVPLTLIPREPSIFHSLLATDVMSLSRITGVLVRCKENISKLKRNERDRTLTITFNRVILDFCDTLWRSLAFQDNPDRPYPTLLFQLTRGFLESRSLHSPDDRLSIIHHPALLGYVRNFYVQTQPSHTRLQPEAIWLETHTKEAYLDYLEHHQLGGLVEFIRTFVRTRT